jgi:hypothetical protein
VSLEQTAQRTSGYATASLVLGIAGFFVFPLVLSILAIVFAAKAREEIRGNPSIGGDGSRLRATSSAGSVSRCPWPDCSSYSFCSRSSRTSPPPNLVWTSWANPLV